MDQTEWQPAFQNSYDSVGYINTDLEGTEKLGFEIDYDVKGAIGFKLVTIFPFQGVTASMVGNALTVGNFFRSMKLEKDVLTNPRENDQFIELKINLSKDFSSIETASYMKYNFGTIGSVLDSKIGFQHPRFESDCSRIDESE